MTAMAPANNRTGQLDGRQSAQKKKRTIIKPDCVGSVLIVMYFIFMYLILITFEDGPNKDNGTVYHLSNSVVMSSKQSNSSEKEHLDLICFCGECRWKDMHFNCNERVAWETENNKLSIIEAKKRNIAYCTKPRESHVSDFFGECQWKDMPFDCNERAAWEMENNKFSIIKEKKRNVAYCRRPPYILSPLCGGCARTLSNMTSRQFGDGVPCHDIIVRRIKHGVESIVDAARTVAEEFPECQICHPDNLWESYFKESALDAKSLDAAKKIHSTKYWRFDQAAPKFSSPATFVLPSTPKYLRIPPSHFDDIGAYLNETYNDFKAKNESNHMPFFIEYNPGLAPIPSKMKDYLPKGAAYLLALRVRPANNCFRQDQMAIPQNVWYHTMMSATNLLVLALLDEKYQMLRGYDIVVDIATQLGFQKDGCGGD